VDPGSGATASMHLRPALLATVAPGAAFLTVPVEYRNNPVRPTSGAHGPLLFTATGFDGSYAGWRHRAGEARRFQRSGGARAILSRRCVRRMASSPAVDGDTQRAYVAGLAPNTTPPLIPWIMLPRSIERGTAMPALGVTEPQVRHRRPPVHPALTVRNRR
jgi:hypothetical protein